jgi:hypothetical protein
MGAVNHQKQKKEAVNGHLGWDQMARTQVQLGNFTGDLLIRSPHGCSYRIEHAINDSRYCPQKSFGTLAYPYR